MIEPATAEPHYIDGLAALARKPGRKPEKDFETWLLSYGFARPRTLAEDGVRGGYVVTQNGLDWLKSVGHIP